MSRKSVRKSSPEPFCPLPLDEKFLACLCKGLSESVFVVELPARVVVYWNASAETLFGYPVVDIVQQTAARLFTERFSFERLYEVALPEINRNGFWRGEWEYRRRDDSRFAAEATGTLLRAGADTYMTLVVREIIEDAEPRATREQLREKEHMVAIGTAAAMLAHEIKNPLNGISTTVQLLERSLDKAPPTQQTMTATVRDLKGEIGRLQALLGDFQTISLPQRLNLQPVGLAQMIRELTTSAGDECRKSKIEMLVECALDLPSVDADADKLKHALLNLITNSCEAMPRGGTVTLRAYVCGDEVCLDVIDTGEGIPEGLQIFDLFASTKPRGTGLGLVIVKQIILAHGGTITFSSEPGKGTTFRVKLRIAKN
jgi:PAS domain S-box-containing protein